MKIPHTIQLNRFPAWFYNLAVGLYLLHMAVMAHLTSFYPDALMRFRMPSFLLVTLLALLAVASRLLRKQVPLRIVIFYLVYFAVVLLGIFYNGQNIPYIRDILFTGAFFKYVLLFSLLFLFEDEPDTRVRQLTVIALVTLFVFYLGVKQGMFITEEGDFDYMGVGYGCALWWLIVAQGIFYFRSKLVKLICLVSAGYFAVFITTYGNRGALLLIILGFLLLMMVYIPLNKLVFAGTLSAFFLSCVMLFLQPLMELGSKYFGFDLSSSRNFRLLSSGMLSYDSGRFPIYRDCMAAILRHPFLGNGVGGDRVATESNSYAHNIVLELCVSLGMIAGILIYCWLLYIGLQMLFRCKDRPWRGLFFPFYTFSMIQLFLSNSLYESGYLVASIVIYLTYTTYHKKKTSAELKEPPLEYQNHLPEPI